MHKLILSVLLLFVPGLLMLTGGKTEPQPAAPQAAPSPTARHEALYDSLRLEGMVSRDAFVSAVIGYERIDRRRREVLTLIDFSKPSTEKRLFVFDMKARRLHLDDGFWTVTGGSLFLSIRDQYYDLGSREASAILEAVGRDMEAGNWGTYDWFASDNGGDYALELSLYFDGPDGEGHDYITVVVCPAMTETAQCLKRLGLASDEDLVT